MEYKGVDESLKYIVSEIGKIEKELADVRTRLDLKTYSLREIAEGMGCRLSTMRNRPWKIPNYGKPDVGVNPARWYYDTVREWYAIPEDERRFRWESMTSRERRKAIGSDAENEKKTQTGPVFGIEFIGDKSNVPRAG